MIAEYPWPHGTTTGYTSHACRCIPCTKAMRDYQAANVARGLAPDDSRHGTLNGYSNYGCRCVPCFEASARYAAKRKAERLARQSLWGQS